MTCAAHSRGEPVRECVACRADLRELATLRSELRTISVPPDDELAARRYRGALLVRAAARSSRVRRRRLVFGMIATIAAVGLGALAISFPGEPAAVPARDPIRIEADHASWSRLDTGDTTVVRLDDGALQIHVDHHGGWHRLVVRLPDGQIDDVGTTFRVGVAAGHLTALAVDEGAVILRRGDDHQLALVRGDRWTAHVAISTSPPAPAPAAPVVAPVHVPGPPADPIAVAIDRLDHHDPVAAAAQLRAFLAHHAADRRGEDAAYLLIIALQRIPDPDGVRAAARDYLHAYPDGLRRSSVGALAR